MSLTELIVVSFFVSVLGLLVYVTFAYETETSNRNTNVNVAQRNLRVWISRMEGDIRRAGYNPLETSPNPFAVTTHTCSDFEFSLDVDANGALATSGQTNYTRENLGYRWNSSAKSLQLKNGDSWRTVLSTVQGVTFAYRRGDASRTTLDCSATNWPTQDIHEVQITITAQASPGNPGAAPVTLAETATVELRNALP